MQGANFEELSSLLGLRSARTLPGLEEWLAHQELTLAQDPAPSTGIRLVACDWRAWFEGAWSAILGALHRGQRLILLADPALPECVDPLLSALRSAAVDLSGICVLWDQRSETVARILEGVPMSETEVWASEGERARWMGWLGKARDMDSPERSRDLAFGHG
ncbi:MAG: hypothetical protein KDB61_14775, partial [Planctomycetes bacterium]|nr:hypothetical protein [Planctomycetota bacterium]